MKKINEGEYVVVDRKEKSFKMWHDCDKAVTRKRSMIKRIELDLVDKDEKGNSTYKCRFCDFTAKYNAALFV